jgi:hypothetical protein
MGLRWYSDPETVRVDLATQKVGKDSGQLVCCLDHEGNGTSFSMLRPKKQSNSSNLGS